MSSNIRASFMVFYSWISSALDQALLLTYRFESRVLVSGISLSWGVTGTGRVIEAAGPSPAIARCLEWWALPRFRRLRALRLRGFAASAASRLLPGPAASRLRGFAASRLPRLRGFSGALRLRGFAASRLPRLLRGPAASRLRGFRGFAASPGRCGFAASAASRLLRGAAASRLPRLPRLRGFSGAPRLRGFAASPASPGSRGFAASRLRGFSPLAGPRLPLH